jgi:hypothetical protein
VTGEHFLDSDRHVVTWQPGTLPPGGVIELQLRTGGFAFTESVSERVRVTADRVDPVEKTLVVGVNRYDDRSAEIFATVQ